MPNLYRSERMLLRLPDVGVATYWRLMDDFGSIETILAQPQAVLANYLSLKALAALADYQQTGEQSLIGQALLKEDDYLHQQSDVYLIGFQDPLYPQLLKEIPKPPPVLYVRGNPVNLSLPQIAMVGARNPSPSGGEIAAEFAHQLSLQGFAITSGLALGIDASAHQGALAAKGVTIAIMGTGIDRIYPSRHYQLAEAIVRGGGCLVTEFPLGTAAQASHFPQRNRLISGLSMGLLVVEAAVKSGSLITASYAMQHNREVFAIPGSIRNPMARGCHQLIRDGAVLVEQVSDMVEHLNGLLQFKRVEAVPRRAHQPEPRLDLENFDSNESQLLKALGYDTVSMDTLLQRVTMDVGVVISCLMGLEIKGVVRQTPQGYIRTGL